MESYVRDYIFALAGGFLALGYVVSLLVNRAISNTIAHLDASNPRLIVSRPHLPTQMVAIRQWRNLTRTECIRSEGRWNA